MHTIDNWQIPLPFKKGSPLCQDFVDTIEDGLKVLERVYHQTGAKLFPRKQLWALLEPYLVAAKLCEETAQER